MSDLIPFEERRPAPARYVPSPQAWGEPDALGEDESINLREIFAVLRRHLVMVLGIAALVVGVAAYIVWKQQPEYRARAVIRLQDERQALTGGIEGAAMEQVMGKTNDPLLSQLEVLQSRAVAGPVVDEVGLRLQSLTRDLPDTWLHDVVVGEKVGADTLQLRFADGGYAVLGRGDPVRADYGQPVNLAGVEFTVAEHPGVSEATVEVLDRGNAIDRLLDNLRAVSREKTDVVDVEFTSTDPVLAQRVVNAVVAEFREQNARAAQQQSRRRRIFVEEQLVQTDSALAQAQLALTEFQRNEQVYSSQQKFAAQQSGMMDLDMRREELRADRRMFQSLLARLTNGQPDSRGRSLRTLVSAPSMAGNAVVAQLYEQLAKYEVARDSLSTGEWAVAPTHPDLRRLNALISSTEVKLIDAIRSHMGALDARIAALDDLKVRNVAEMQALPASGAEEVRLVQQVETIRMVADQLRSEYQKARIAEAVEAGQVEIVDPAPLPDEPIGSGKGLKMALALVLGLMLGGGSAFMVEHLNTSIRRKEDMEGALRVPGLAVIPRIASPSSVQRRLSFPISGNGNGKHVEAEGLRELVTVSDLRSSGSEAYRTLRTNLIFSQAVQTLKTLVVTSSGPSEGKTTTTANLAVTFAQQGMRVLVVDCDLRKARLHKVFRIDREPGLTQLMLGQARMTEAIRPTQVDGLFVLPSGVLPPNPMELLGGELMRKTLEALGQRFDLILLDSPPLLAAADAAVLGTISDGVLLVVRAGHTDRGAAQHAMQQLRNVGAHVVGAVLNDPDAKVPTYGGYYYYDYYGDEAKKG